MTTAVSWRRHLLITTLIGSLVSAGCVRTLTHRVARFEPTNPASAAATTQPVRTAALWKVKVRGHGEKDYHGIDGTERLLQRGDVVGFRRGADGVIYAVANRDQIPLALTDEHARVVWQAEVEKTTDFGEVMAAAGEMTAHVLLGAAAVVGVGAVLFLAATDDDDDDCDRFTY